MAVCVCTHNYIALVVQHFVNISMTAALQYLSACRGRERGGIAAYRGMSAHPIIGGSA